jgi:hypothetical protein
MKIAIYVLVAVLFAVPTLQAAQAAPVRMVMVAEKDSKQPLHEDYSLSTAAAYVEEHMKGYSEGRGLSVLPSAHLHRRTHTFDAASMDFLRNEFKDAHEVDEELDGKGPVDMQKMTGSLRDYERLMGGLRKVGFFEALGKLNLKMIKSYLAEKYGPLLVRAKDEGAKGVLHTVLQYKFKFKSSERIRAALDKQQKDIVTLLVENKAYVNDKDDEGRTPLHYAAIYHVNPEVVSALLHGMDIVAVAQLVNEQDRLKNTPLHYAIMDNNLGLIELFLTFNALLTLENTAHQTPLSLARTASKPIATLINKRYKQIQADGCCCGCLSCLWSCFCCS